MVLKPLSLSYKLKMKKSSFNVTDSFIYYWVINMNSFNPLLPPKESVK